MNDIVDDFHRLYYDKGLAGGTWNDTYWLGVKTQKLPLDLWLYQEIIFKCRPNLIIETGTAYGGSALFLASICDMIGYGEVVTIDIVKKDFPKHPRITYITGNSIEVEVAPKGNTMVILDSDHSKNHVLKELNIYSKMVSVGQYLIVEDTNLNHNPVHAGNGPGPNEALKEFIHDDFVVDESKFLFTFNPGGYLRRVANAVITGNGSSSFGLASAAKTTLP